AVIAHPIAHAQRLLDRGVRHIGRCLVDAEPDGRQVDVVVQRDGRLRGRHGASLRGSWVLGRWDPMAMPRGRAGREGYWRYPGRRSAPGCEPGGIRTHDTGIKSPL